MNRMKQLGLLALLLTSFAFGGNNPPYEYKPADLGQFNVTAGNSGEILPSTFLREYDPVTVFFNANKTTNIGPETKPSKFISITPEHPGEYIWIDKKTLEFRPTTPWPPIEEFSIKASGKTKKLKTLMSPPIKLSPANGTADIGKTNEINLSFAYAISIEKLKKLISFEATPLPGIDRSKSLLYGSADFRIKAGEVQSNGVVTYRFIFDQSFPLGHKVRTHVKLSDIAAFQEGARSYSFNTRQDFTPLRAGTNYSTFSISSTGSNYSANQALETGRNGEIVVDFSSALPSLSISQAKSLFNFSPSPNSFSYSVSGSRVIARVDLDPERIYKVMIQPIKMKDQSNRPLIMKAASSFYVYRNPDQRYIRWAKSHSIVEQYGPQHLPLEIANINSFDLRIHKINPLNKAFWPFPSSAVMVDEKTLPPGPGEEPTNEKDIHSALSKSSMVQHIKMLGSPHYSTVINADEEGILKNQTINLKQKLQQIAGKEKPGTYLIGFRELKNTTQRSYVKVLVTDLCLSTVESKGEVLFVVTSYKTGKPVPNATVLIEGVQNGKFQQLFKETTNSSGQCKAPGGVFYNPKVSKNLKRVVVKKGDDVLVLDSRSSEAPPMFNNNHWLQWQDSWLSWLTSKPYDFSKDLAWRGFLFTERPIYRPEEKVHIKGYLRTLHNGVIHTHTTGTLRLEIQGPDNVWRQKLNVSDYGSFDYTFTEKDLPTGEYYVVSYYQPDKNAPEQRIAETSFRMDAYRVPKFEVKLTAPDKVPNDRPFTVELNAGYYAGGPVIEGSVQWRVQGYPYSWSLDGWDDYMLSSDSRFSGNSGYSNAGTFDKTMITDDNGTAQLIVQPQSIVGSSPMRFSIEGTVTDVDAQTVTDSRTVIALPSFVLGLKADRFIRQGKMIKADLIAVDQKEKLVKGQKVSIALKKMSWHSYLQETDFSRSKPRYITNEQITLVEEREVTTDGINPTALQFDNREPGVYIIECTSTDKLGRRQTLQIDLFLAGDQPVVWQKSEQKVFETVTNKKSYVPGDVARIILKSPYQNGRALAITENPNGKPAYEWVDITNGQGEFTLKVTEEMLPMIPVSFLLMRPRIAKARFNRHGAPIDPGKPETIANTTWIQVNPEANTVTIELKHEKKYSPGDTMYVDLALKDWKGRSVSGEVVLWLVDKAVLSLGEEKKINPLKSFIPTVKSHISIRDSRNMALGMLGDFETPGGDGMESRAKMMQELAMMDEAQQITVRKNFKTVPYYNAAIRIDQSGKKRLAIALPDNLTRFAVRAVAVSSKHRFGAKKSEIQVRLPVIVQPMLPRFVRVGDTLQAGGVARVVEGSGGSGTYAISADGLNLTNSNAPKWTEFNFPGRKAQPIAVSMTVPSPSYNNDGSLSRDSVSLQMTVKKKGHKGGDAFRVAIPILPDRFPVTNQVLAMITKDSSLAFEKLPPTRPNTLLRKIQVSDEQQLLKILGALRYLFEYQHGCTEQRVSRSYPSLIYQDLWRKVGVEPLDNKLDVYVKETLEYLKTVQSDNGLFCYWPGSDGQVYLTAYVVEFLAKVDEINKSGSSKFPMDKNMYSRAIKALKESLRSDYAHFLSGYKYYEQAAAIYALVRTGNYDMAYLTKLATSAQGEDPLSMSRIYKAILQSKKPLNKELSLLETELWNSTVFKLRNGKEVFAGMQSGSTQIGSEVHGSEINEISGVMGALSQKSKDPKKVTMIHDELMTLGRSEGWGNTHTNGLALLALHDYLNTSKKGSGKIDLTFNGQKSTLAYNGTKGMLEKTLNGTGEGRVSLNPNSPSDTLFVKLFERYLPLAPGSDVTASQNGFVMKRQIIYIQDSTADKKYWIDAPSKKFEVSRGSIIEEHIQLTNPKLRHYVAVVIPLAAGVEYLNPELKIAAAEFTPNGKTDNKGDYQMFLDDRIVYYFNTLPAGTFNFSFRVRATIEGSFTQPAAYAEDMYHEEINGNSPGARIVVTPTLEKAN